MDKHYENADCLTFGELVSVTLDRAPAEYRDHLARYENIIAQLPEANAEIITFSDFMRVYNEIKGKLAACLSEPECRLLKDNEAYIQNFVFNTYVQCFT